MNASRTPAGRYIQRKNRERLFVLLRAAGFTLKESALLLRYTLREAYDLSARVYHEIDIEATYLDFLKRQQWQKEQKERQRQPR